MVDEKSEPDLRRLRASHNLARAKTLAAEKGLRYQTYLKMLLHQALNSEEKRAGHR
jgi:predicted DNA binding CopG/RHH family protein